MKKTFVGIICDQWSTIPPVVTADLTGQTVIVVGANIGIGLEASKHFARMNPGKLIMGCRSEAKGKAALAEVENETGYKHAELWLIDLANFASVKSFAERFGREEGRLDILVMNAGILMLEYEGTVDGWESTIQVNHLSTALLSLLLLPHLSRSSSSSTPSRLVIVSSDVHYLASIQPEVESSPTPLKLLGSKEYSTPTRMSGRYRESKLLNVFFVRALAAHLSQCGVTPVAVNPGFCYSQLRRPIYDQTMKNFFMVVMEKALAWTSEEGSRQLVFAAIGGKDDESKVRGGFVAQGTTTEVSDYVLSEKGAKLQAKVWDETIEILSAVSDQVKQIGAEFLTQ
ncbi:NAD(P)-binding protein [Leucogyrophana mollusca]|uniref:NAD(P)-binding protein n=1 Tax=Leucogyrophana mollusca TaxID=85980 RepID=A0ACB8B956_9AGAM|nr:NAD(P)-binding protein [Leucogyrophana mollusca]